MNKAVIGRAFGPPETYALEDYDPGQPAAGQVRIAVRAAGISYVDVLTAAGQYQVKPPLPFIPGSECSGIVETVGEGVTGLAIGDCVAASNWGGVFAEAITLAASKVRSIPHGLSFEEAAVLPSSYYTAYHALKDRAELKPGETLLVLGAGGATGYAAVQVGKQLGARVVASASSEEKRALALAGGADVAVEARAEDWREQVKVANGRKGVDVVFDPVGGEATDPAFRSLGWKGRHLIIGFPGGIAALRTNLPLLKGASLVGVDIRQFGIFEPAKSAANQQTVFELAGQGILKPAIAKTYPLASFVAAMQDAAAGRRAGRIVLTMD